MPFPKTTMANPGRSIIDLSRGISRGGSLNGKDGLTDMKNMRADKHGLYVRAGSKNMLPVYGEWAGHYRLGDLGFEKVTISESRLMLGVDADGKLWALSEQFPQVKFAVCSRIRSTEAKQIVLPTIHGESSSRYFGIEMEQFYFIVDERMNALRIDKRGKVEWWYDPGYKQSVASATADTGTSKRYQYPVVAEKAGYGPSPSDACVYLDCSIATNTKPLSFSVIENREGNVIPIRGVVRFANVNDCNVIGEWSDETVITDWLDTYYSRHPGVSLLTYEGVYGADGVTLKKFIDLKEQEPVFATPTDRTPLYLGYADAGTEPSLSNSFIGTAISSTAAFALYYLPATKQWIASIGASTIADWETDLHLAEDLQILVASLDASGHKLCSLMTLNDNLVIEAETNPPVWSDAGQRGCGGFSITGLSTLGEDTFHRFIASISGDMMYVKETPQLKDIRRRYQSCPTLYRQFSGANYNSSQIVIFGNLRRHVNRTFQIPFGTNYELTEWKHLGFDTWTKTDYTPDYTKWTYDNALDLIAIEPERTGDVILDTHAVADHFLPQRFAVQENGKTTLVSSKNWLALEMSKYGDIMYQESVEHYPQGRVLALSACPIMSPQYRKLRNIAGYEIREFAKTARSCATKPAYNGGKLFFIDGGNLIMSDQTLLDLGKVKGIVGTPRAVVSFADGALCFTDRGAHLITADGNQQLIPDGESSSKAIPMRGAVMSISDAGNILLYSAEYDKQDRVRCVVTSLSSNIPDVVFGSDSCLAAVGSMLCVSTKNEVWGFDLDDPGWKALDKYDTNIAAIGEFNGNLVVLFNAEPAIELTFTTLGNGIS